MAPFAVKNIAIIGAGPAGLASARYLCQQRAFERIVIYEQKEEVGGVWNYSSQPSQITRFPQTSPFAAPDLAISSRSGHRAAIYPSPMYDNLNTNIPHTLMNFSDLAFPEGTVVFPTREEVQSYLVTYSQPVRSLTRLCTKVAHVRLLKEQQPGQQPGRDQWVVESLNTLSGTSTSETFDAVVVASGHYALEYVPDIEGIAEFHARHPEIISHSKTYRNASPFSGKRTVVVGNAASGLDIARQINAVCKHPVLISVQTPTPAAQLEHTGGQEVPQIEAFLPGDSPSVRFCDGRIEQVDAVVLCTGYLFTFPFLDNNMLGDPPVVKTGRRVQGLYRHLFHIQHPTLVFPGLLIKAVPFPICEGQAAVFSRVWANHLTLPPISEMVEWEKRELAERGEAMHVLKADGGDISYINGMYEWAMKATESEGSQKPPLWEGEMIWQRTIYKHAKIEFEKHGRSAKSLVELGFGYNAEA